jgi:uncharacterized protein (DUF1697 family)
MIKMDHYKMLENMVQCTNIQSGNVFVTTEEENAATVGFKIKQEILKFWFMMYTIVIGQNDLENCLVKILFEKKRIRTTKIIHASYLRASIQKM